MKKFSVFIAIATVFVVNYASLAKPVPALVDSNKHNFTRVQNAKEYNTLVSFIKKLDECTNAHNIEELKALYSDDYVNADGIDLKTLMTLIKETWKNFPDMALTSNIQSVHINNDYATIETFDIAKGTTAKLSEMTKDTGNLTSNSKIIIYLKKFGNDWKIVSDKIVYEKTFLKYGKAKSFDYDIVAPEQVLAGSEYTATVEVNVPQGVVALGSITREPIVYPEVKSEEIFRQIPPEYGVLERIMNANSTNNNELAVASIGFTELVQDMYQNAQIKLTGMVLMMQRVNVIPKSTFAHKKQVIAKTATNE